MLNISYIINTKYFKIYKYIFTLLSFIQYKLFRNPLNVQRPELVAEPITKSRERLE